MRKSTKNLSLLFLIFAAALGAQAQNGYKLMFEDQFDGNTLNTENWNIEINGDGGGNGELQYYCEDGVKVENGNLVLTARRQERNGKPFTSGRINSKGKVFFKYGKVEASIKMPKTANGLWPAFWMLGANIDNYTWPQCGEIDIVEMGNVGGITAGTQDRYFNGACHWGYYENGGYPNYGKSNANYLVQDGNYHTFTLEWDEEAINMYFDGDDTPYYSMDISDKGNDKAAGYYFQKPFHLLFNLAVGGMFPSIYDANNITAIGPNTGDEASMYVDWVRVYQLENDGVSTFCVEEPDEDEEAQEDPDTELGRFGSAALDENGETTFDFTKGTDYVLISTSQGVTDALSGRILKNYNVDNTTNFLYVWDSNNNGTGTMTYNTAASPGVNSFGYAEAYNSFKVGNVGWSGLGFASPNGSGGKDLSMIDDSYVLHFAMKGTDLTTHKSHTVTVGNVQFIIGQPDGSKPCLGDYKRDGNWYYFDIPVKWLRNIADPIFSAPVNAYLGNVIAFSSGGATGTQLKFDNIFFYKSDDIDGLPETDEETELGNYGSVALDNEGNSTFDFENSGDYVPISVSTQVKAKMNGKIKADYSVNGAGCNLYIWENTYTTETITGQKNSFGYDEDYVKYTVAAGWSGMAVNYSTATDLSMLDDTYWLHFSMKGDDYLMHVGQTITIGGAKFIIGPSDSSLASLGDYKRDGQWCSFDIPVKALKVMSEPLFANAETFTGDLIVISSGGRAGNTLEFDNIFFYTNSTKSVDDGGDTTTKLGKYVSADAFDFSNGKDYVLIDVSDKVKAGIGADNILKDYNADGKNWALYIWAGTYADVARNGALNSFGYDEDYHALKVNSTWSGMGYKFETPSDLSMLLDDDSYYLHFAMKGSDYLTHVNYTIGIGKATIYVGTTGDGFTTDFRRDGEWYNFDIPVSKLTELAGGSFLGGDGTAYNENLITISAGTRAGNELNFDNIFFYKNLNPASDDDDTEKDTEAPTELTATVKSTTTTTAVLTLTAKDDSKGPITYIVECDDKTYPVKAASGRNATATIKDLTASTNYTAIVKAKDTSGNETEAIEVTFRTAAPDVKAPEGLTASVGTVSYNSTTVTLKATDDSEGTITYTIYNGEEIVATVSAKSGVETTATIKNLTESTTYDLTVIAKDASGNETSAQTLTVTTTAAPAAPTAPTVKVPKATISYNQAVLSLSSTQADGLDITYVVTVDGKDYTVTGKSGETATVTVTGLTKETIYNYSAVAKNAAGKVSEATTGTFKTGYGPVVGEGEVMDSNKNYTIKYTYTIEQDGDEVSVSFTCTNASEVLGLVGPWIHQIDNGNDYDFGANLPVVIQSEVGKTIQVRAEWNCYGGGQVKSETISYTLVNQTDSDAPTKPEVAATPDVFAATITAVSTDPNEADVTYTLTINEETYTKTAASGETVTFDVDGLEANTSYVYSVIASNADDCVSNANKGTLTTLVDPDAEGLVGTGVSNDGKVKYTYSVVQVGENYDHVQITIECTNLDEVSDVFFEIQDRTNGNDVYPMELTKTVQTLKRTVKAGDVIQFTARMLYAGGEGWIVPNIQYTVVDWLKETNVDANNIHHLSGTWNKTTFKKIDAEKNGKAYDLTGVTLESGTVDVKGLTTYGNCLFITNAQGTVSQNELVKSGDTYTGYNIKFVETSVSPYNDVCTTVPTFKVSNPEFKRTLSSAGRYVTTVIPFDCTVPEGCKFYALERVKKENNTVNLAFNEVTKITANTPYLAYIDNAELDITGGDNLSIDFASVTGSFANCYETLQTTAADNIYTLSGGGNKDTMGFRHSVNTYVPAFRGYLVMSDGDTSAKTFKLILSDATGIRDLDDDALNTIFNVYSIDGKVVSRNANRVSLLHLPAGVYVVNGKKLVVK